MVTNLFCRLLSNTATLRVFLLNVISTSIIYCVFLQLLCIGSSKIISYHDLSTRDTHLSNIEGRPVRVCVRADLLKFCYPVNIS